MHIRECLRTIQIAVAMSLLVSPATAAVQFPCSASDISIDESFISHARPVCFRWLSVGSSSAIFSQELVVQGTDEYLSFVVDRARSDTKIEYRTDPVSDWLPALYKWAAKGATDWGDQIEIESDLGTIQYMTFSAGDGAACLGFRLYYGLEGSSAARIHVAGAYCNAGRDRLGETEVRLLFDMVKFNKGYEGLHTYFFK